MNNIVIFGAGNILLSDEGFGVHFTKYLADKCSLPEHVSIFDAGTLGIMAMHIIEEADYLYIVDVISVNGMPGDIFIYDKEDIMLNKIPTKMSPHQIGVQEVMLLSDIRGKLPKVIKLFGIIPESLEPGTSLSKTLEEKLPKLEEMILAEIKSINL